MHSSWVGWPCAWTTGGEWLDNVGPLPGDQNVQTGGNWRRLSKACKVSYSDASRVAEQCDSHMVWCDPSIGGDREETSGLWVSTKIWLVENYKMHMLTLIYLIYSIIVDWYFIQKLFILLFVTSFNTGTPPPKLPDSDPLDQLENLPQRKKEVRWQEYLLCRKP